MRAAALKGKTIKKVHQELWDSNAGKEWILTAIEFTDGSVLRFNVSEGEGEYGVVGIYPGREVVAA